MFNQLETHFDLHDITDDDERYRFLCRPVGRGCIESSRFFITSSVTSSVTSTLAYDNSSRQGFHTPGFYPTDASFHSHLATTPDNTSLESLDILADRALASENDVKESSVGVAEIRLNESDKLIGIIEDISRHLKKLETAGTQKNNLITSHQPTTEETERQIDRHFYQMQMRNLLTPALLKPKIMVIIMGRMFFLQINKSLSRPLRR